VQTIYLQAASAKTLSAGTVPLLLAISDNGPQMRSYSTREFLAAVAIAQQFGRPHTPQDQAWIETLFGHVKGARATASAVASSAHRRRVANPSRSPRQPDFADPLPPGADSCDADGTSAPGSVRTSCSSPLETSSRRQQ
jgi:hypothetical protein